MVGISYFVIIQPQIINVENRKEGVDCIIKAGYDIKSTIEYLEKLYDKYKGDSYRTRPLQYSLVSEEFGYGWD